MAFLDHHAFDVVPVAVAVRIGNLGFSGQRGRCDCRASVAMGSCPFIGYFSSFRVGNRRTEVDVEGLIPITSAGTD